MERPEPGGRAATEPEADGVEALDADRDKGPDERVEDELGYTGVDANAAGLDDEDDDYADEDNLEDEEAFEDDEGEEPNNKA